jgi:hypothetical protein
LLPDVLTNCGSVLGMQLPEREARSFADRDDEAPARLPKLPRYHALLMLDDHRDGDGPHILHPLVPLSHSQARAKHVAGVARGRYGRRPELAEGFDLARFVELADRYEDLDDGRRPAWSTTRRIEPSQEIDDLILATIAERGPSAVDDESLATTGTAQTSLFTLDDRSPSAPGVPDGAGDRLAAA